MKEFAFDIKLSAVVRVKASSEKAARKILPEVLDSLDLTSCEIDGFNDSQGVKNVVLTEASISMDDEEGPYLFEIDGEDVA